MVIIHGRGTSIGAGSVSAHGVHMLTARDAMNESRHAVGLARPLARHPAVRAALLSKLKTR